MAKRGLRMMNALAAAAPAGSVVTSSYLGQHKLLIVYGAGAPYRQETIARHKQAGGKLICVDLGYWEKHDHMRAAVGSMQPTKEQIYSTSPGGRTTPQLREDYSADGPVILIGLGRKTRSQYGFNGPEWEIAALKRLRERFPDERIVYRPKGQKAEDIGCKQRHEGEIDTVLLGASLVVCRHSNVAIDACVAGIPVECEAGAAHALYHNNPRPATEQRIDFLQRLAWWQWAPHEAAEAWKFLANWI